MHTEILEGHIETITVGRSGVMKKWHTSLNRGSPSLPAVTGYAGTYNIFPAMFPTTSPWYNMV
jgi:hypothetical protein